MRPKGPFATANLLPPKCDTCKDSGQLDDIKAPAGWSPCDCAIGQTMEKPSNVLTERGLRLRIDKLSQQLTPTGFTLELVQRGSGTRKGEFTVHLDEADPNDTEDLDGFYLVPERMQGLWRSAQRAVLLATHRA